MGNKFQAIRGMNDILPDKTPQWQYFETFIHHLAETYGFSEIRFPIVEKTELFVRGVGEVTDIVEKEMYTFADRNGDSLSLRPEGTAGCVRAALQHGLLHNQQPKLYYLGPLFRHERPQKGRYRQFYQVGFEWFGVPTPEAEVELLALTYRLWKQLGLVEHVRLEINTIGSAVERAAYAERLVTFYKQHQEKLDEDSQRRLHRNPLRILDSKNPDMKALNEQAPKLIDCLSDESRAHFDQVCELLDMLGIQYEINPKLVRGLDYYCHTVFEWVTDALGAQGTICAGGRYDGLVEQLGGKSTPAVGFAMGVERILEICAELNPFPDDNQQAGVFIVTSGVVARQQGLLLAKQIRDLCPQMKVLVNCDEASFKSQFKRADQSGAEIALVLGDDEVANACVTVKYLREDKPQAQLKLAEIASFFCHDY